MSGEYSSEASEEHMNEVPHHCLGKSSCWELKSTYKVQLDEEPPEEHQFFFTCFTLYILYI